MATKIPSELIRDLSEKYRYIFENPGGPYLRAAPEGATRDAELRRRRLREVLRTPADPVQTAVRGYAHAMRNGGAAEKAAAGLGIAALEAAQAAALLGGVRYNPHPVRGPLRLDRRELGTGTVSLPNRMTVPLPNTKASAPFAFVSKTGLAHPPGDYAYMNRDGRVVIPTETAELMEKYGKEHIRFPDGRRAPLETAVALASDIDASKASLADREARLRELNDAVNPVWMYRMYERDILRANKTLEKENWKSKTRSEGTVDYDILSREAAATILSNPIGTNYRMWAPKTGEVVFSPVAVSGMHRSRFDEFRQTYDIYNAGYLPVQAEYYEAPPRMVDGRIRTPVMRIADHYDTVVAPADLRIPASGVKRNDINRTAYVRGTVPHFGLVPVDPGGVTAAYRLDGGRPVIQPGRQFAAGVSATQLADKAGDSPHRNFRNFLATDKVPESIFGYPVVQDGNGYTERDVRFFEENPKAAGFYDLGDEEVDEGVPRQAWGSGRTAWSAPKDVHEYPSGKYGVIGAPRNWMERQVFKARGLNEWGGNLDPDAERPWHVFRGEDGKITGYGDARTTVVRDGDSYVLVPTIADGRLLTDEEAEARYRETGEHWARVADAERGGRLAAAIHGRREEGNLRKWNEYLLAHWDEVDDELKADQSLAEEHARRTGAHVAATRQAAKAGVAFSTRRLEGNDRTPVKVGEGVYRIGHGFVGQYWADDGHGGRTRVDITENTPELTPGQLDFAYREQMKDVQEANRRRFPGYDGLPDARREVLDDIAYHAGLRFAADGFIRDLGLAAEYDRLAQDPEADPDAYEAARAAMRNAGYQGDLGTDAAKHVFDRHVRTYRKDSNKETKGSLNRMNARLRHLGLQEEK